MSGLVPIPAAGDQQPWPPTEPEPAKPPRGLKILAVVLAPLALTAVALFTVTAFAAVTTNTSGAEVGAERSTAAADSQPVAVAKSAAEALFSYDYRRIDDAIANAKTFTTDEYGAEHEKQMEELRSSAEQEKLAVAAEVVGAGESERENGTVEVLAFVNQTVEHKNIEEERIDKTRVVLAMVSTEAGWKVSDLEAI